MKFSIITPAYMGERWIAETIESVLSQKGDFEIEYIVVVDSSTDRTLEIVREYEARIRARTYPIQCKGVQMTVIEPIKRAGMYVAMNAGFARATGNIHAWIPADDIYRPNAFHSMSLVFNSFPEVIWLRGNTGVINEDSAIITRGLCRLYDQKWLSAGVYGMEAYHVDQPSVFWRAELWKKRGPFPSHFKSMGDYWLWTSFAKHARLWTVNAPISYYRKQPGQDSAVNAARCKQQMWEARGNKRPIIAWMPRVFFYAYDHASALQLWMEVWYFTFFPSQEREYFEIESGKPVKRTIDSFVLH
jgi:glycosyltransferase involved in cell wall biosynthesis